MIKTGKSSRILFITGCIVIFGGFLFAGSSFGKTAREIDASADAAMARFYKMVNNGKEAAARAKGREEGKWGNSDCRWAAGTMTAPAR